MTKSRCAACLAAALYLCLMMGRPASAGDRPKMHKAGGVGEAHGFVLDADTQAYLSGASIALSLPPDTEPVKGSTGLSNESGYYVIKAPLGASSSHFAADRLGDLSIASILSGGGKKVEHIVDVSEMILTISKPGYKTFYGTVPVEYADADRFRVRLCPVLLMPDSKSYVSYAAPHMTLGRVENIHLPTPILSPNEVVKYTITFSHLPVRPHTQISIWCVGSKGGSQEVKNGRPQTETTYSGQFRVDKNDYKTPGLYTLSWYLSDNEFELPSSASVTQIIAVGVPAAAREKMAGLFAAAPASATPLITAVPKQDKALINQMAALLPPDSDSSAFLDLLDATPPADGSPSLYQRAAAKRIERLKEGSKGLTYLSTHGYDEASAIESTRREINQLEGTSVASVASVSPAQKQQEFDQQVARLKASADDPKAGTPSKIALAHLYYSRGEVNQAWPLYESLFQNPEINKESNFYLFHDYAVLLFQKGRHEEALTAFSRALANGHTSAHDSSQLPTQTLVGTNFYTVYSGPERSSINGFAFPEAADDLLIVKYDAGQSPNTSWLSETIRARAMGEIGLVDQGLSILQRVVQSQPDEPEALFALAMAQSRTEHKAEALATVNRGLALNPNDAEALALQTGIQKSLRETPLTTSISGTTRLTTRAPSASTKPHNKEASPKKPAKKKR